MPNDRSPIQHHLLLHRIDPEQRVRWFYSLMIERDLFWAIRLARNWGWIGTTGQELGRCSRPRPRLARRWRPWPGLSGGADIGICEAAHFAASPNDPD